MILSDIELRAELQAGRVVIDPQPSEDRINGASVDMTLHNEIWEFPDKSKATGIQIDPSKPGVQIRELIKGQSEVRVLSHDDQYVLSPNRLTLGQTGEIVELPLHLAARIEGKSSLARLGVSIHATAPTVLPGFKGRLTLEMNNIGPYDVVLKRGMLIAQLIVERVGLPVLREYRGQFQGQK